MAAELSFQYSLTHLQNLAETTEEIRSEKNRLNPMQTPEVEEDDSWEVRAFAEDTAMATTWPPRSYTCSYCRREFRSAQALGGHMNVHRRDRARLHQTAAKPAGSFIVPPPEFASNGGLCLLYQFPNPNIGSINNPPALNSYIQSPSSLLSFPHHSLNSLMKSASPSGVFPANEPSDERVSAESENGDHQEVDLELRLGQNPSAYTVMDKEEKICNREDESLRKKSN